MKKKLETEKEVLTEIGTYCDELISGRKKTDDTFFLFKGEAEKLKAACDKPDAEEALLQLHAFRGENNASAFIVRLKAAIIRKKQQQISCDAGKTGRPVGKADSDGDATVTMLATGNSGEHQVPAPQLESSIPDNAPMETVNADVVSTVTTPGVPATAMNAVQNVIHVDPVSTPTLESRESAPVSPVEQASTSGVALKETLAAVAGQPGVKEHGSGNASTVPAPATAPEASAATNAFKERDTAGDAQAAVENVNQPTEQPEQSTAATDVQQSIPVTGTPQLQEPATAVESLSGCTDNPEAKSAEVKTQRKSGPVKKAEAKVDHTASPVESLSHGGAVPAPVNVPQAVAQIIMVPIENFKPHPLVRGFYPLAEDVLQGITDAMIRTGRCDQRFPVQTVKVEDNNYLVWDGFTRMKAAMNAGIKMLPTMVSEFKTDNDLLEAVIFVQNRRRSCSGQVILISVEKLTDIAAERAKSSQGSRNDLTSDQYCSEVEGERANEYIARMIGKSRTTVIQAKAVLKDAELKQRVISGELSISGAYELICKSKAKPKEAAINAAGTDVSESVKGENVDATDNAAVAVSGPKATEVHSPHGDILPVQIDVSGASADTCDLSDDIKKALAFIANKLPESEIPELKEIIKDCDDSAMKYLRQCLDSRAASKQKPLQKSSTPIMTLHQNNNKGGGCHRNAVKHKKEASTTE